ncbi:hypothetical protein E0Z10_g1988 [Xylaria hypoxylon]|uniref:Uncharacterized protein n=1 Tax=Xylaria hypoxylon TaxID=37992 RepID=A0A4Z0Z515_9PEZI|nr:hypothetical protein E0Z10_g1988 [Xylaria hypoxylon]
MTRRKVIADSEDEDEGDDDVLLLQPGGESNRPEPEPLSPHHRPSSPAAHNRSSDVTDPSFFADVYDNQQSLAVQQSHLVENIVRQSQRASASSGDVSLPVKKKGRANPSSGTDVTSPMVPSRPRNHTNFYVDDVSEFTTPRKSTGQEWEVPSSPEDATAPNHTECPTSKEQIYSERKRRLSGLVSSPAAVEMPADEETTPRVPFEDIAVEDQLDGGLTAGATSTPVTKRAKLFHHDYVLPDTSKFYIAQSSLTTMQKLEYQKINVSNGQGGLPGSLPNQKSSGATTIAYSTPSGYSSIPPLPWEESLAQPASAQRNETINISSSPDMVDSGFDLPNGMVPVANMEIEIPVPSKSRESPVRRRSRTPVSKGRKRARRVLEEDELCQDNTWDSDDFDLPQGPYKPRAPKRRSVTAAGFVGVQSNTDTLEDISNEPMVPTQSPPKIPAPTLPDTDPPEPEPEPQPEPQPELQPELQHEPLTRKRGRKKKQPATKIPPADIEINEDLYLNQKSASPDKAAAAEPSPEKPKKKRGRPRKSDSSKAAEGPLPELPIADELPRTDSPRKDNNLDTSAAVTRKQKDSKQKAKEGKSKTSEEIEDTGSKESRLPLKEVDNNPRTPSKPVSTKESPAETRTEPRDEKATPKTQLKENPKLGASQSKVTYRVGLSKRSRIAPLLKSIRK